MNRLALLVALGLLGAPSLASGPVDGRTETRAPRHPVQHAPRQPFTKGIILRPLLVVLCPERVLANLVLNGEDSDLSFCKLVLRGVSARAADTWVRLDEEAIAERNAGK